MYGLTPEQLAAAHDGANKAFVDCEETLLAGTKGRSDGQRPSMGQDMQKGRRTEIDYLNGYICDRADDHGVPVPVNRAVVAMIKTIEAKQRPLSMENMEDPNNIYHPLQLPQVCN